MRRPSNAWHFEKKLSLAVVQEIATTVGERPEQLFHSILYSHTLVEKPATLAGRKCPYQIRGGQEQSNY